VRLTLLHQFLSLLYEIPEVEWLDSVGIPEGSSLTLLSLWLPEMWIIGRSGFSWRRQSASWGPLKCGIRLLVTEAS
jgi:hypothetical protein